MAIKKCDKCGCEYFSQHVAGQFEDDVLVAPGQVQGPVGITFVYLQCVSCDTKVPLHIQPVYSVRKTYDTFVNAISKDKAPEILNKVDENPLFDPVLKREAAKEDKRNKKK